MSTGDIVSELEHVTQQRDEARKELAEARKELAEARKELAERVQALRTAIGNETGVDWSFRFSDAQLIDGLNAWARNKRADRTRAVAAEGQLNWLRASLDEILADDPADEARVRAMNNEQVIQLAQERLESGDAALREEAKTCREAFQKETQRAADLEFSFNECRTQLEGAQSAIKQLRRHPACYLELRVALFKLLPLDGVSPDPAVCSDQQIVAGLDARICSLQHWKLMSEQRAQLFRQLLVDKLSTSEMDVGGFSDKALCDLARDRLVDWELFPRQAADANRLVDVITNLTRKTVELEQRLEVQIRAAQHDNERRDRLVEEKHARVQELERHVEELRGEAQDANKRVRDFRESLAQAINKTTPVGNLENHSDRELCELVVKRELAWQRRIRELEGVGVITGLEAKVERLRALLAKIDGAMGTFIEAAGYEFVSKDSGLAYQIYKELNG